MAIAELQDDVCALPNLLRGADGCRTLASYERELRERGSLEIRLRAALAADENLLRQKDILLQERELLSRESDHRLLNGLQMVVSMLSLQSRASANREAATQLAAAANRVAMIERVHRRLHSLGDAKAIMFKNYLEGLCRDYSAMLYLEDCPGRGIVVRGIDVSLSTHHANLLGFIATELITNAVKYGEGEIVVSVEPDPRMGWALGVSNDGSPLPEGFDPAGRKGLGMTIVRSLVQKIGGEFDFGPGKNNQGARFAVLFS